MPKTDPFMPTDPSQLKTPSSEVKEFAKTLIVFITIALLLRASVVEAYKIPSGSMKPTLEIGDHIIINKLSYGLRLPFFVETVYNYDTPEHGDVVVFTRPDDPSTDIIKRVIGIPGDEIEVRGTKVYRNKQAIEESYAQWVYGGAKDFGPVRVPEGTVLLLGDNRDESKDSRFWTEPDGQVHPFLDIRRIKGRAFLIYWNSSLEFNHLFNWIR